MCNISPYTKPDVNLQWNKLDTGTNTYFPLPNNPNKYKGGYFSNPSLIIYDVQNSDSGSYQCYARNTVGESSGISQLICGGKLLIVIS